MEERFAEAYTSGLANLTHVCASTEELAAWFRGFAQHVEMAR